MVMSGNVAVDVMLDDVMRNDDEVTENNDNDDESRRLNDDVAVEDSLGVDVEDEDVVLEVDVEKTVVDPDADAADEDVDVDVEVEDEVDDLDIDGRVAMSDVNVDAEDAIWELDVYAEVAVVDLDVDVDVTVAVDERVQDDDGKDDVETGVANVADDVKVLVSDVAIVDRRLVVMEWLLPIQEDDVGLWVVEPNDDKMRKHSDMMQVDVVHVAR